MRRAADRIRFLLLALMFRRETLTSALVQRRRTGAAARNRLHSPSDHMVHTCNTHTPTNQENDFIINRQGDVKAPLCFHSLIPCTTDSHGSPQPLSDVNNIMFVLRHPAAGDISQRRPSIINLCHTIAEVGLLLKWSDLQ